MQKELVSEDGNQKLAGQRTGSKYHLHFIFKYFFLTYSYSHSTKANELPVKTFLMPFFVQELSISFEGIMNQEMIRGKWMMYFGRLKVKAVKAITNIDFIFNKDKKNERFFKITVE